MLEGKCTLISLLTSPRFEGEFLFFLHIQCKIGDNSLFNRIKLFEIIESILYNTWEIHAQLINNSINVKQTQWNIPIFDSFSLLCIHITLHVSHKRDDRGIIMKFSCVAGKEKVQVLDLAA